MKTGQDALVFGIYVSECCDYPMMFSQGNSLRRCPICDQLCTWDLLKSKRRVEGAGQGESKLDGLTNEDSLRRIRHKVAHARNR